MTRFRAKPSLPLSFELKSVGRLTPTGNPLFKPRFTQLVPIEWGERARGAAGSL